MMPGMDGAEACAGILSVRGRKPTRMSVGFSEAGPDEGRQTAPPIAPNSRAGEGGAVDLGVAATDLAGESGVIAAGTGRRDVAHQEPEARAERR